MKWRSLEESVPGADARPLREILAERTAMIAQYVPQATQAIHEQVIEGLRAQGICRRALAVGAKAPGFKLRDHNGKTLSSAELLETGRLAICFFRGRWCPFCVAQLEAMNLALPQIRQAGASLVAVSPQTVQQSFFMADQHRLGFPLLSDTGNRVAHEFGLVYRVPGYQEAIYRRAFVNLPFTNGDESWELPIPAVYVVDRDGTILFAAVNPDYKERPEPEELVEQLARP